MWPQPHHYTYALSKFLDQSPDLTVLVKDGQVMCHKPVLACHSRFLKDVLLHGDTDVLALPDFGKEEMTNLIHVLYGQVEETLVSKQLMETLAIDVQKMATNAEKGFVLASSDEIVDSDVSKGRENDDFPTANVNEIRSIFDIDDFEDENSYSSSTIFPSLSNLCAHMETYAENEDQEIIYQCSVCSLICSSLEELGSHMDIHADETPVNQEVILGDIEEAVLNADFVIADEYMDEDTNAQEAVNEEIKEEIILEEIEDNSHMVTDEEVEVQDPSIETTEITVGCDDAIENEFNSEIIDVNSKDISRTQDISSTGTREETVPENKISDIETDFNMATLKDFSPTLRNKNTLNLMQENSNDFHMDNPSEIKMVESGHLYSCQLCSKAFSTEAVLLLHMQSAHKKMNTDLFEKLISSNVSSESSLLSHTQSSHHKIVVDPISQDLPTKLDRNGKPTLSDVSTESSVLSHTQSSHHKTIVDQISQDLSTKLDRNKKLTLSDVSNESPLLSHTQSSHQKINVDSISQDLSTKLCRNEKPTTSDVSTELSPLSPTQNSHQNINNDPISQDISSKSDRNEKPTLSDLSTESISQNSERGHQIMNLDQMNLELLSKSDENKRPTSSYVSSLSFLANTKYSQNTQKITLDQNNLKEDPLQNEKHTRSEFVCHFCEQRFKTSYSLNEHTVTFHTELLATGGMVNEDDILTKAIEMTDFTKTDEQVANQEASLIIYTCTLCESSFSSTKALTQHVNSNHVIQPTNHMPVSCNYCDIHFITRSTLAKHYQAAHPGQQPIFQCPQCGKALKTFKSLERHEMRHTDVRPFQCGQCRAKFHLGEDLKTHGKRGCKPSPRFSLPAPNQNASRLIPRQCFSQSDSMSVSSQSFSMSVPKQSASQSCTLPVPSQSFSLYGPSQSGRLPILSSQFSLPTSNQNTSSPSPNSNPAVSISFDSNTNSINMSCTNCFLKFGSHEDYNSHLCTNQSQPAIFNSEENFIPEPIVQSIPSEMHLKDEHENFRNNPLLEVVSQLSVHQEENSNGGLESFERIVNLKITENKDEKEAVANKNPNTISLKTGSMLEDCLTHKYSCSNCQYNTNIRKSFKKHLESQKHKENSSVKKYFCDRCDMAFGTLKFLDDHMNRKHKINKIKEKILKLREDKKKIEIEATQFEEIRDGKEILGDLISKSGRKITPRMFADGDKVFTPLLNCLRKRTFPINESSSIESISMTNENETKPAKKADTKTDIDAISTQCELCQDFFVSRRSFFLHMLTHVPDGIRASLPKGQHGWCPHCPGPVPVEKINSHVADSHPEMIASSEDVEFGEIPCDADLEKMLEDGFDLDEISQDELDMLDVSQDPDLPAQCPPTFIKLVPVDLNRYGINVTDYM